MSRRSDAIRDLHVRLAWLQVRLDSEPETSRARPYFVSESRAVRWALDQLGLFDQEELDKYVERSRRTIERRRTADAEVST